MLVSDAPTFRTSLHTPAEVKLRKTQLSTVGHLGRRLGRASGVIRMPVTEVRPRRIIRFTYAELHERANRRTATDFLKALIKAVPYKIHTVLTDNGIQFTDLPKNRIGPTAQWRAHMFDMLCDINGIEHRLTKPNHP